MLNVMLVDDERMALEGLQIFINWEKHGFRVCALCTSGEEALARYAEAKPDLVVTDLYMPGVDGLTLMERLREKGYAGEFIIVSGYSDFEKARRAMRHNVADYLLKPIDPEAADRAILRVRGALKSAPPIREAEPAHAEPGALPVSEAVKRMASSRIAEHLTLEGIAANLGYNATYLGRVFREEAGCSFRAWLMKHRMERAAKLLRESAAPVRDVAAAVGYLKYQNFAQAFKAQYRRTPQAYRAGERG